MNVHSDSCPQQSLLSPTGLLLVSFSVVGLSELPILRDCIWSLYMEGSFLFPLSWLKTKGVLQPCFIKDPDPFSFKEKKTPNCQPKRCIFQVRVCRLHLATPQWVRGGGSAVLLGAWIPPSTSVSKMMCVGSSHYTNSEHLMEVRSSLLYVFCSLPMAKFFD